MVAGGKPSFERATEFLGYEKLADEAPIVALLGADGQPVETIDTGRAARSC